jgi:hypothetical protein
VYIIDPQGKVVAQYFEDDYKDRVGGADILARQFGVSMDAARGTPETGQLKITTAVSNATVRLGLRIA